MTLMSWWRNQPLRSKGLSVIAIPCLILLAAIIAIYVVDAAETRADVAVALMDRAETSVRSYLLVPRREFLSEYSRVRKEVSDALERLHRLVEDDAQQAARLRSVESLIIDRLKALDVAGRTRDESGLFRERSIRTGQAVLESLRSSLGVMQEQVEADLATQSAAAERQATLVRRLLLAGGAMGIGGGVLAALLFTAGLGDRMRELGDAARDISKGAFDTRLQPANDEIGVLAEQLRTAALRLEEREQQLHQARDDADAANRAKIDFLLRLSAELRTPIDAILGSGQVLQLTGLDPERAESVAIVLAPEPVQAAALLRDAIGQLRPIAMERGIALTAFDADCDGAYVLADRQRLTQVLLTLLSNGVQGSRTNGRVYVTSAMGQTVLRLAVHDTGPGMAAADIGRVFEPFGALADRTNSGVGSVLGLPIARRLIEATGGRIGVHSEPGAGSAFWIELPLAGEESGYVAGTPADGGRGAAQRSVM